MAIDKNSKAYQTLLNKGYSEQQIDQMYSSLASGQNAKDIVANTKPVNTTTTTTNTTTTPKTTTTQATTTPKTTTQTTTQSIPTQATQTTTSGLDKNSKNYQTLLSKGYTEQQIDQMYNALVSGQSAKDIVANVKPANVTTPTQTTTTTAPKTKVDGWTDVNNNLHIVYSDGSTEIIPGGTKTQPGTQGQQTGLSADGKTYTFQPGYEPIYPEGEIIGDKSTNVANLGKIQQKSKRLTYQEDTQERYDQILTNLDNLYVSHPEYFTDRTTFDANFQLDQRSLGQQNLMVEWFYKKKKDQKNNDAISGLNDGQSIYDAVNGGGLTYDQLELLKGTPQYDDYLSILRDKKDLAVINNDPASLFIEDIPDSLEEVKNMIMAGYKDMDKYKPWEYMMSLYDGPDGQEVINQLKKDTKTALEWKAKYDSIDSNVRSELEGTGATKGYMQALTARRQNDMIPSLNMAYAQVQASQTNYNLRHQSVEDLYGSYVDEANYEITKYNARIQGLQTMWGIYKDVAQYDWQYKQQARLLELQNKYNNPQIDSDDPDEARRALQQALQAYYDEYGTIIKRDINKTIEDIYAYAKKNGVSLSTALQKNFVDQLKNKSEYKELQKQYVYGREYLYEKPGTASKSSSSSSSSSKSSASDVSGLDWESLFGDTKTWWGQTSNVTDTSATDDTMVSILNSYKIKNKIGNEGGTDKDFVNNYLKQLGLGNANITDNSSFQGMVNDTNPRVGNIAYDPSTGDVGIITSVDPQSGYMTIVTSDAYGDKKISKFETNYLSDYQYINPSKALTYQNYGGALPQTEFKAKDGSIVRLNDKGYLEGLIPQYKSFNENGKISESVAGLNETLESMGVSGNEFRNQAQNYAKYSPEAVGYVYDVAKQLGQVAYLYDQASELLSDGVSYDTVKKYNKFVAYLDNLIQGRTLDYFVNLKQQGATFGAMSDAEWKIIGQACTALSELGGSLYDVVVNGSSGAIQGELKRIEDELYSVMVNSPAYAYADKNRIADALSF